jgi:hypothetical protein
MKYIFTHIDIDGSKIEYTLESETCSKIINSFYYFMKGISFHDETIIDAMKIIINEYEGDKDVR